MPARSRKPPACSSTRENPRDRRRPAARTPDGIALLDRAGRTAAGRRSIDQGETHELPVAASAQQTSGSAKCRASADVILGLEVTDFWGTVGTVRDSLIRTSRSLIRPGTKLISITAGDLLSKGNLPGFPALSGGRPGDRGRCRGDAARAHRGVQAADHRRSASARSTSAARSWPRRTARRVERARADGGLCVGRQPDQHGAVCRPSCGRRSRTRTGRWSPDTGSTAAGRAGCGTSTSTITSSAAPAAQARRLRRAGRRRRRAREQEARPAVGHHPDRRRFACTRRASCGRRRITRSRCWRSCTTTAPTIRRSCTSSAWPAGTTAASTRAHIGTTLDDPNIDYAKIAQGMGVHAQGPITNPERSGAGDQTGDRGGQARRAVADRRGHAATVGDRRRKT